MKKRRKDVSLEGGPDDLNNMYTENGIIVKKHVMMNVSDAIFFKLSLAFMFVGSKLRIEDEP